MKLLLEKPLSPDSVREIPWRERFLIVVDRSEIATNPRWIVAGLKTREPIPTDEGLAFDVDPVPRGERNLIRRFLQAKLGAPVTIWYTWSRP